MDEAALLSARCTVRLKTMMYRIRFPLAGEPPATPGEFPTRALIVTAGQLGRRRC